jgi:hypothetical protein
MFVLPPLADIRKIVEEELPPGHCLVSVELTGDPHESLGTAPFTLVVTIREDSHASAAHGVGHEIAERIRKRWSGENVHVKLLWSAAPPS